MYILNKESVNISQIYIYIYIYIYVYIYIYIYVYIYIYIYIYISIIIPKSSKTVKKTKKDYIKFVTVRHHKMAFYSLKPITQSKIITQELKTVEKSIIFDVKSVNK